MKKIFESIYLFSKLTTSLVLFGVLITLGYFFYASYQNQDKVYLEKKIRSKKINKKLIYLTITIVILLAIYLMK